MRQCQQCSEPIPSERNAKAKFCTKKCSGAAYRNSGKPCTLGGCERSIRAKGLCASHYNQEHAPNRHAKKLVACAWCGTEVLKSSGGGRKYGAVCSEQCRKALTFPYSKLPADHWALWVGKSSAWPRYGIPECTHCGAAFVARSMHAKYCSTDCTWRWHEAKRAVHGEHEVRRCQRCDKPYQHHRPQRIHCSDLCRDLAATERGAHLHYGWIRPAMRQAIYERDSHACWLCGEAVDYTAHPSHDDWAPTLDHILPRSKGGGHDASNLRTAHRWCNSVRSDNEEHPLFAVAS